MKPEEQHEAAAQGVRPDRARGGYRVALARLNASRATGDPAAVRAAADDLFGVLLPHIHVRVMSHASAHRIRDYADLDDIVDAASTRLLSALYRKRDLEVPIESLLAGVVEFAIRDFRRDHAKRVAREELRAPTDIPEPQVSEPQQPEPAATPEELTILLASLNDRDKTVVIERVVNEVPAKQVAERLGMTPAAVRQVCARVLTRLRKALNGRARR